MTKIPPYEGRLKHARDRMAAGGTYLRDRATGAVYWLPAEGMPVRVLSPEFQRAIARTAEISRGQTGFASLVKDIVDEAHEQAMPATIAIGTYYDRERHRFLVHCGAGAVIEVADDLPQVVPNGADGITFVDEPRFAPVDADAAIDHALSEPPLGLAFRRALLCDFPPPAEDGLTVAERDALIIAFWLSIFLRGAYTRATPILGLIGPHDSAKSSTARRLGKLYAGPGFQLSVVASAERAAKDIAASLAHRSLVVQDDLNDAAGNIQNLLCSASTGGDLDLSQFHETLASVSYPLRGALAVTAIRPAWATRADVVSRVLPVRITRPPRSARSERARTARALSQRTAAFGDTLRMLFLVLHADAVAPVTRFDEWEVASRAGARAARCEDALVSALEKLGPQRAAFAAEGDSFLAVLLAFASQPDNAERWWTAAELVEATARFQGVEHDQHGSRMPTTLRSAEQLGHFLARLEKQGSAVVIVERGTRAHGNILTWRVRPC